MIKQTTLKESALAISWKSDWYKIALVVALIAVWVYFSGIGGFVWQNSDHWWRNEIFNILVDYDWPAIKGTQSGDRAVCYYIGFWLVPAIFGKIFGMSTGYFAQYIWAVLGIVLTYFFICRRLKKITIFYLILFIFFSGLDILGLIINDYDAFLNFEWGTHIETWIEGYQYSSFTTQLFWVFNQAIYGWLITLIILEEENNAIVLLIAAGLLSATLPMVGLCVIALVVVAKNIMREKLIRNNGIIREFLRSCITYENIVGVICIALLGMLYLDNDTTRMSIHLSGRQLAILMFVFVILTYVSILFLRWLRGKGYIHLNIIREHINAYILIPASLGVLLIAIVIANNNGTINAGNSVTQDNSIITYLLFLLIEIGAYLLFTIKDYKNDVVYIASIILLLLSPLIVIGAGVDFCMRVSIPGLLILFISFLESIMRKIKEKHIFSIAIISLVIIIGAITPLNEFVRPFVYKVQYEENGIKSIGDRNIFEGGNFSTSLDSNLFYKYFY